MVCLFVLLECTSADPATWKLSTEHLPLALISKSGHAGLIDNASQFQRTSIEGEKLLQPLFIRATHRATDCLT